jgi:hypothetical protein
MQGVKITLGKRFTDEKTRLVAPDFRCGAATRGNPALPENARAVCTKIKIFSCG